MADQTQDVQDVVDDADIPEYGSGESGTSDAHLAEEQARSLGWKPQEEFNGDPSKWTDASEFLEVHGRNNGALRKANEKLSTEMTELRRRQDGIEAANKKIFELQIKKAKEEHANELAFLKAQKKEALRNGDHVTADEFDEQIDAAKERGPDLPDEPPAADPKTQQMQDWRSNPQLVDFVRRNPWIETEEDMADYTVAKANRIRQQNPNIAFEALLDEAVEATKKAFPQKFGAATRRNPVEGATSGATSGAAGTRAQTYNSMPADARKMCDDLVRDRMITKDEYVKQYFAYDSIRKAR